MWHMIMVYVLHVFSMIYLYILCPQHTRYFATALSQFYHCARGRWINGDICTFWPMSPTMPPDIKNLEKSIWYKEKLWDISLSITPTYSRVDAVATLLDIILLLYAVWCSRYTFARCIAAAKCAKNKINNYWKTKFFRPFANFVSCISSYNWQLQIELIQILISV